jgi:hypothetical protein
MPYLTIEAAENIGLFQLYKFSPEKEQISTQWGMLTTSEWLEKEEARINRNPLRRAAIVRMSSNRNMFALFVNTPTVWEHEARALGYCDLTHWSSPDNQLLKSGFAEPRSIIIRYKAERSDNKRTLIVRRDNSDQFAVFYR